MHLDALFFVHGDDALHIVDLAKVVRAGVRLLLVFILLSLVDLMHFILGTSYHMRRFFRRLGLFLKNGRRHPLPVLTVALAALLAAVLRLAFAVT